jgi:predicted RNA binding protein YcfA (HicA-like mRNA interferase family)
MGRMAQIVAVRMIRALIRLGWVRDRQKGSHVVLTKGGRSVTVPLHPVLKEGTARAILKQAGVAEDDFFAEY